METILERVTGNDKYTLERDATANTRPMNRRTLFKLAGVSLATIAMAQALPALPADAASGFFAKGADISWLPQMEAHGYIFKNTNGVQQDLLTILKGYGINSIRLRTFVNPSNDPANGHCSQSETIAMALRCKKAGLKVDIDFHFGDTWNSVGSQKPPAAWAHLSYTQMLTAMKNYVHGFMTASQKAGFTPDWVQIGNEENQGICVPTGSLSSHPNQMTGLLNTAYDQVKATFPSTPVIIHLAQPQKLNVVEHFFDTYKSLGGKWDITGFSSYGHGSAIPTILANMETTQKRYGKPVMQVEYGGKVTNPTGTANDLRTLITGIKKFGGLGIFYWEPEGYAPFTSYGDGAWNATTKEPTAALDGFLND